MATCYDCGKNECSHGSTVAGYCPMGCGATLFLGTGGYVTCADLECPTPDAVSTLLGDPEHEHIVVLADRSFDVQHPLRERLDGELFRCELHDWLRSRPGPPGKPGRYRVHWRGVDEAAQWEALDA